MQEEIQQKTIALVFRTTRLTSDTLRRAVDKYMAQNNQKRRETKVVKQEKKNRSPPGKRGKQTVKSLVGQGKGTDTCSVRQDTVKDFERVARKYGVDFAIRKDKGTLPPQYTVFFKACDKQTIHQALSEYTINLQKKKGRTSVLQSLKMLTNQRVAPNRERNKVKEHER